MLDQAIKLNVQCRWAAYPPEPNRLQDLFELGYQDTMTWLRDNGKLTPGDANSSVGSPTAGSAQTNGRQGFGHAVAQAAMEAPSCDQSLKEAVVGNHTH